jgi:hypothetical protein
MEGGHRAFDWMVFRPVCLCYPTYEIQQMGNHFSVMKMAKLRHHAVDKWEEQKDPLFENIANEIERTVQLLKREDSIPGF